jgi:hypothetical protein
VIHWPETVARPTFFLGRREDHCAVRPVHLEKDRVFTPLQQPSAPHHRRQASGTIFRAPTALGMRRAYLCVDVLVGVHELLVLVVGEMGVHQMVKHRTRVRHRVPTTGHGM